MTDKEILNNPTWEETLDYLSEQAQNLTNKMNALSGGALNKSHETYMERLKLLNELYSIIETIGNDTHIDE